MSPTSRRVPTGEGWEGRTTVLAGESARFAELTETSGLGPSCTPRIVVPLVRIILRRMWDRSPHPSPTRQQESCAILRR